jgi:uncharacterized protein YuzE
MEMILRRIAVQCEYDPDGDTAHIHVADPATDREAGRTYTCEAKEAGGRIRLHLDSEDRLATVEVLGAHRTLPLSLLRAFSQREEDAR